MSTSVVAGSNLTASSNTISNLNASRHPGLDEVQSRATLSGRIPTTPIYADAHADIFYEALVSSSDIVTGRNTIHVTVEGMRAARQRLQVCSLWTPAKLSGHAAEQFCWKMLEALEATAADNPNSLEKVTGSSRLLNIAHDDGAPIGLVPWMEGGSPLRGRIDVFHQFADRGVKGIGLTWNHGNEIADGCGVAEPRRGLTTFGVELVREMEDRHVFVDAAHLPEPAFWNVMAQARRPVVVTHTGMRAIVPIIRNVSDEMARAIADTGGFVGIDFYPGHLRLGGRESGPGAGSWGVDASKLAHSGPPSLTDLAAHVAHAVRICGEDHVAFGGDFDGFRDSLDGLSGVWDVPKIAEALRKAGLTSRQVEKVYGENLLRVLIENW